jgi:hypothetical protein
LKQGKVNVNHQNKKVGQLFFWQAAVAIATLLLKY